MGMMADTALNDSVESFLTAGDALAEKVIKGDDEIDDAEREIDLECLRTIATRQPVRGELRFIFAVLKTITDLERIGDEAVNIARRVLDLKKNSFRPSFDSTLIDMRDVARTMLRDVLKAFETSDGQISAEICRRDAQLDRAYASVFNEFIERLSSFKKEHSDMVRIVTDQMWIARHLERIGDHVTNIAERVYFVDKGEILTREKEDEI
jgi:phosphate transport system protein